MAERQRAIYVERVVLVRAVERGVQSIDAAARLAVWSFERVGASADGGTDEHVRRDLVIEADRHATPECSEATDPIAGAPL
jgi:hypothetical protein